MNEQFIELCRETVNRIDEKYYPGAYGWIETTKERLPVLWQEIKNIEEELDDSAKKNIPVEKFKGLIEGWEKLVCRAIEMARSFLHSINTVAIAQMDQIQFRNREEVNKDMKVKDMFPSKYLGKDDILAPLILTIGQCVMEDIKDENGVETKPVLYFEEYGDRGLILNKTNATTLEDLFGDSEDWAGNTIQLYVDHDIRFGKQKIGGVRLRRTPAQPSPQQDSQDVPF